MAEQYLLSSNDIIGRIYRQIEMGNVGWPQKLGMDMPSDKETETYKWLGMVPAMREWVGRRQAKGLNLFEYELKNKLYELTLEFGLDDLRRDKTKQIDMRIGEIMDRYNQHWMKLLSTLIINGTSIPCYDGQFFFSASHSEGDSGVQSNLLTSADYSELGSFTTPSNPTAYELAMAINKVLPHFKTYKDDVGEPINETVSEFLVMVPVNMEAAVRMAVTSPTINTGSGVINNPLAGGNISFLSNPRLSASTELYFFVTNTRIKPFILQEEKGSLGIRKQAEGSSIEFNERIHQFGVEISRSAGFGFWQLAIKATLS